MTILSNAQIIDRLGDSVIIEPFNPANVNTSSYDVTLGEYYFIEHKPHWWSGWGRPIYNIWDYDEVRRVWGTPQQAVRASHYHDYKGWRGIDPNDKIILIPPKHTILAHTQEYIGGRVPALLKARDEVYHWNRPCTSMMKARSSMGRNFIEVCKCAGYGDVGYTNRWTMEITNNSRYYYIPLVVGRRIAQIVFMETGELVDREMDYPVTGKYQSPLSTDSSRLWKPEDMLPRLDKDRDIPRPKIISTPPSAAYFYDAPLCPHGFQNWDLCPQCGKKR